LISEKLSEYTLAMGLTSCQKVSANEIIQALVKGAEGIEIVRKRDGHTQTQRQPTLTG
jgi:hypothetical protein